MESTSRLWRFVKALRTSFDEPLESEFCQWYTQLIQRKARRIVWIAITVVLIFMLAGGPFLFAPDHDFSTQELELLNWLRYGVILPTSTLLLYVTYSRLFFRWYDFSVLSIVPLHTACFCIMDVILRRHGDYSLSTYFVVAALSPYLIFNLLLSRALLTAALVWLTCAFIGWLGGLDAPQWRFDLLVMFCANSIIGVTYFGWAHSVRAGFLDTMTLTESSKRDGLTDIYNRRAFDERIASVWLQAARTQTPLALLFIDIDCFKNYNDTHGHQAGDDCLVHVARTIGQIARRPLDIAARYGGEEFAVLLYDVQRDKVDEICQQVQLAVSALNIPHPASDVSDRLTVSIGAAWVTPSSDRSHRGFIQLADEAVYHAKEGGRNRSVVLDLEYETLETGSFRIPQSLHSL